ncbi:MAG: glycosyltransferase family 2 protein, partial [Gaiellaceae bacterium]
MTPRFSVVVPTFQRREVVIASVAAFEAQDFAGPFEVVVIVDGSTDGTADALRSLSMPFPLSVVEQQNRGLAAARNRGAEEARGEFLLFLDDDMEPHPRLLNEHDRSHLEGADVVVGHIRCTPIRRQAFSATQSVPGRNGEPTSFRRPRVGSGSTSYS